MPAINPSPGGRRPCDTDSRQGRDRDCSFPAPAGIQADPARGGSLDRTIGILCPKALDPPPVTRAQQWPHRRSRRANAAQGNPRPHRHRRTHVAPPPAQPEYPIPALLYPGTAGAREPDPTAHGRPSGPAARGTGRKENNRNEFNNWQIHWNCPAHGRSPHRCPLRHGRLQRRNGRRSRLSRHKWRRCSGYERHRA